MPLAERVEGTAQKPKRRVELSALGAGLPGARYAGLLVLVAGAYFLAGKFGLQFASLHPSATMLWAPTGISLAALLLGGYRMWPAIVAGAFLVNISTTGAMLNSLEIAAGDLRNQSVSETGVRDPLYGICGFAGDGHQRDGWRFNTLPGWIGPLGAVRVGLGDVVARGHAGCPGTRSISDHPLGQSTQQPDAR